MVTAKKGFFGTLLVIAVILAVLAPKAAVNVDEQLHYPHAKNVVNWYFTGGKDQSCLDTPQTNLKYYGQSVDNFTALVSRLFRIDNEFLVRHYTGAFFFLLLLLFTGLMAGRLTGSWIPAILTLLALSLMPRLAGQAFGNLKDIPFAAGYMAGIFYILKFIDELPYPSWKSALRLAVTIAFTFSVRAGGLILFGYLGLGVIVFFLLYPSALKQIITTNNLFIRLLMQGFTILTIGYFAGLLFWPYALQNVFLHPLESLRVMEHYKVSIRQVFEGELIWSTQLPWYYLPKWLLISTPLFILTGFVLYLWSFSTRIPFPHRNKRQIFNEAVIFFSFAFPMVYVVGIDSNLYSGVRQMLFILPPLTLLAITGAYNLLKVTQTCSKILNRLLFALFLIMLAWPLKHQVTTFPVDYVYFNSLVGGNKKAWGNYEYDYYFHGIKAPARLLSQLAVKKEITVAMNCNLSNYFDFHPNIHYQYTRFHERSSYDWDYGIFGLNYIHPFLLKNDLWQPSEIVKTFYHKGNPIAILVKRTNKDDFYGISEIKIGNLEAGTALLEMALEKDPNNVWLYVQLAKAKLDKGDIDGFVDIVNKGRAIHPLYEPFYLLEADRFFEEGRYRESEERLTVLFRINPRYLPAKRLFEEVKKKTE